MIRVLVLTAVLGLVAACSATSNNTHVASGEKCSKWEGESCVRDTQCFSLWCVNGSCARREP